jgi:CubicO group peptidase (beta-lactamase class C family)
MSNTQEKREGGAESVNVGENLRDFIEKQVRSDQFSGAVYVVKDGDPIVELATGFADKEKEIPNSLDTIFNIGSIDKMFTGVAVVQLAESGKLSFGDNIGKHLPDYPKKIGQKTTIHQTLTHTDGFPSYFNKKYIQRVKQLKTVGDYLELFKDEPLLFEPGSKYQYSNSGYVVLGAVIEAVSGTSYYDYVNEKVFKPSGMSFTQSNPPKEGVVANGYTFRKPFSLERREGFRGNNKSELPAVGSPAGGGYSTCSDLYRFSTALTGNKLLSPEMTKEILTPKVEVGKKEGTTLHYGYGFQILDVGDAHYRYGHAGEFAGVNARLDIYPWLGYTVAVLANYDEPAAFRVANEAGRLIL